MSGVGLAMRRELQQDLSKLINEEASIDAELRQYFSALSSGRSLHSNKSFDSADLSTSIKKIERFAPCFEAMVEDSKKLATQVEDCRSLSDRLSVLVRRLDIMQIHAQQALACTEDIINLKDWKQKMSAAMDEGNLPLAVSFIRQVHDIEVQAARASDDFGAIQQAEREVRQTVQKEFATAIEESNIPRVMALCPLLQTLGLEVEARDVFLSFVEKNVFTAVSADASAVDGTTDAATGYAQALSSVFNSSYLILQQYLPMVIQGMENSLGDIYFIRKLHAKCEVESGLVLKRYMKFRHIKNTFVTMKVGSSAPSLKQQPQVTPAEIHVILDELALLIQYCCMYSKYLKQLCDGAQSRKRAAVVTESTEGKAVQSPPLTGHITVFNGPTDFDKMVDELINRYYMEGEHWLMRLGVKNAFLRGRDHEDGSSLDECFFVLQRCGQRAVATNNIHAACAVLHLISDLLSSDLLSQLSDAMTSASIKAAPVLQEHLARFTRSGNTDGVDSSGSASLSKGLQSAISLASSLANSAAVTGGAGADDAEEGLTVEDEDDPYGLSGILDSFNVAEVCIRYTERLMRDVSVSGENVFGAAAGAGAGAGAEASQQSTGASSSHIHGRQLLSPDMEKLKVSRENFEAAKLAFQQALRQGIERVSHVAQSIMKDVLVTTLGRNGPLGGVRFDLSDEKFDAQPALNLLPKVLLTPFELLLTMCTSSLSEANKEIMVGMLADACCERLEHFISQSSFRFAGALKFEECVRALSGMFARFSSGPIRGKFSRLREVMLVLTSDTGPGSVSSMADNFSLLTVNEVLAFAALRLDVNERDV